MAIAQELVLPPKGTPITLQETFRKYGLSTATIARWVSYGWIAVLDPGKGQGSRKFIDEHDIAYIVANNDVSQGKRILVHP